MQAQITQASHVITDHFGMNARVNNVVANSIAKDANGVAYVWKKQLPLIISEFTELSTALLDHDLKEIRDGIADVIVTVEGMLHRLGIAGYAGLSIANMPIAQMMLDCADILQDLKSDDYFDRNPAYVTASDDETQVLNHGITRPFIKLVCYMYGIANALGLPVMVDQEAVFESNMSKFDTDKEVAERGIAKYEKNGIAVRLQETFVDGVTYYIIKSAKDQIVRDKDYPEGKFLKSVNFFEPRLAPIDVEVVMERLSKEVSKRITDMAVAQVGE